MKIIAVFLVFLVVGFSTIAQSDNPKFVKTFADSLGGDDYGMKSYVLVILKTGSENASKAVIDSLSKGHMANIVRLAGEKKLVVAGPLRKNDKSYEGIFILDAKTIDEAKRLLDGDPLVRSGLLVAELYGWYGSAALPMYLPFHDKIQKKNF